MTDIVQGLVQLHINDPPIAFRDLNVSFSFVMI